MSQKRTTLKDIADNLNVSITTVNRALKNHPDISPKLKEQILFLAQELHYRPNFFASSLRKKHSGMIGVIIPKIIHYFSSTVISGIIKTCSARGYQVIVSESGNELGREEMSLMNMINSGVDGMLIAISNHTTDEGHLAVMEEENIPFVFFDKVPDHIDGPKVLTNDVKGAFMATEHLVKQGYTRIAHIKGQQASRNAMPRFHGYRQALDKYGIALDEALVRECASATEEEGYGFAQQFLQLARPPDAIFCVNDETAIGVLAALHKAGVGVPQEVGVVGFSNSKASEYMHPSLSSIEQFGSDIGKIAAEMLIELIQSDNKALELKHRKTLLEPKLFVRESSGRFGP